MRARLALLSSGVVCELREVALRSKPAEMLAISPKGTVPVLQLPDDQVLEQSLDIMLWALRRHDPEHWLATSDALHADHLALIAQCDGPFKANLDRYKYPNRYDLPDGLAHRTEGSVYLASLNAALTISKFLAGEAWGLPDAAIAPFVRQWAHTDPAWFAAQAWPALQTWLSSWEISPGFDVLMTKHVAWKPEDAPVWWGQGRVNSLSI